MYRFNNMYDFDFSNFSGGMLALVMFFLIVLVLALIALYIISSFGIMYFAKKNNLNSSWLAFFPGGRDYLVGKLGYEVYAQGSMKNPNLTWILFGFSLANLMFTESDSYLNVISLTYLIITTIAYYNIFKAVTKNYAVFTVFTALLSGLGGVFLFAIKNNIKNLNPDVLEEDTNSNIETEVKNIETEEVKEKIEKQTTEKQPKKVSSNSKYCSNCGTKLIPDAKFCNNCGTKVK